MSRAPLPCGLRRLLQALHWGLGAYQTHRNSGYMNYGYLAFVADRVNGD